MGKEGDGAGETSSKTHSVEELEEALKAMETKLLNAQVETNQMRLLMDQQKKEMEQEKGLGELEMRTEIDNLQFELQLSQERIKKLELEQAAHEVLKAENERLTRCLGELQDQITDLMHEHAVETNTIKKETFNSRLRLENTFRKTLQEMQKKHQEEAFQEMDEEAKMALIEKARVQEELSLQTIGIESLTSRYMESTKALKALKTDNGILKEHNMAQTKKIAQLKGEIGTLQEERGKLNTELEAVRGEASKVGPLEKQQEHLTKVNSTLQNELDELNKKYKKVQEKLARANEKIQKGQAHGLKKTPYFTPNDNLLQALANIGNKNRGTQDAGANNLSNDILDLGGPMKSNKVKLIKIKEPKILRESGSVPTLRKSEYTGILESWNAKFAQTNNNKPR